MRQLRNSSTVGWRRNLPILAVFIFSEMSRADAQVIGPPEWFRARIVLQGLSWTPDSKAIGLSARVDGKWNIHTVDLATLAVKRVTSDTTQEIWETWSPDGRRVAFQARTPDGPAIAVINRDGSNRRMLTHGLAAAYPTWSPDGRRIAFMAQVNKVWQLHVVNADGSDVRQITWATGNAENPRWSPDGTLLAWESDKDSQPGDDQIYVVAPDGKGERQITHGFPGTVFPTWAPDGRSVLAQRAKQVIRIPLNGGEATVISERALYGAMSPDGRHLALIDMTDPKQVHLVLANPDGTNRQVIALGDKM